MKWSFHSFRLQWCHSKPRRLNNYKLFFCWAVSFFFLFLRNQKCKQTDREKRFRLWNNSFGREEKNEQTKFRCCSSPRLLDYLSWVFLCYFVKFKYKKQDNDDSVSFKITVIEFILFDQIEIDTFSHIIRVLFQFSCLPRKKNDNFLSRIFTKILLF